MSKVLILCLVALASGVIGDEHWKSIPEIPTNRRTQFYVLHDDGSYKYGYDTGKDGGSYAKQKSTAANQVEGYYGYPNVEGNIVNVKYTAGVQGFVPENVQASSGQTKVWSASSQSQHHAPAVVKQSTYQDSQDNSDASYSLSYNTGDHSRTENSDASGNVKGSYSYVDEAGNHDLSYVAGPQTGFQVTGGSLSVPNGLLNAGSTKSAGSGQGLGSSWQQNQGGNSQASSWDSSSNDAATDGSYSFSYNAGDSSRQESSDASGNVKGQYAYTNEAGNHDLTYVAGADTGFLVTGGSLSVPNGLLNAGSTKSAVSGQGSGSSWQQNQGGNSQAGSSSGASSNDAATDGSYSFSYNAGDSSRQESSDASGNVKGQYAYTNEAGNHDLTYVAGADTGFLVTGGSLSVPNGLLNAGSSKSAVSGQGSGSSWQQNQGGNSQAASWDSSSNDAATDGSYSFSYNAGDSSRQETSDASGNVKGQYAYTNEAGNHDLTYVAGADTGFLVTGGSLSVPNGLLNAGSTKSAGSGQGSGSSWQQNQGENSQAGSSSGASSNDAATDGSYSFSYNAGDSSRQESSDASGNVKGQYAYTNEAGNHDLTYVAGADTGFLVTGGSLSVPNGLLNAGSSKNAGAAQGSGSSWQQNQRGNSQASSWDSSSNDVATDGSYSFSYNAGDSSRQESSDASGNVKGQYAYTNEAGNHDLTYVAGADIGFLVTGGSLSVPNGLLNAGSTKSAGSGQGSGSSWQQNQGGNSQASSWDSSSNDAATDGSYSFSYNAGDSSRQESSDASGNVKGQYAYTNEAGNHDLTYVAGADTGFLVTGGSLSVPNGLLNAGSTKSAGSGQGSGSSWQQNQGGNSQASSWDSSSNDVATDGSYSFSYNAGDSSRQESSDASGNVKGQYAYTNEAGNHDLTYVAGADTGFLVTGGSLSVPNGLLNAGSTKSAGSGQGSGSSWQQNQGGNSQASSWDSSSNDVATDGSYSFSYNAGDSSRQESSDASGNVKGQYAYTNEAGNHDLTYVAGADTGFLVTGGSLAEPNGLKGKTFNAISSSSSGASQSWKQNSLNSQRDTGTVNEDGSYSFSYNTGDHSRTESADASGNVKGQYAYTDEAGNHDLSYIAGDETGFQVIGGSLSVPNGLVGKKLNVNSYGNSKSSYAGSSNVQSGSASQADDGSYKFSYNTGEHSRNEAGDASGSVQGSYSYQSEAGQKDLHYKVGEQGFIVTGGNLAPKTDLNTIDSSIDGSSDDGSYKSDNSEGKYAYKSSSFQNTNNFQVKPPTQYLPPSHNLNKVAINDALVQTYLPPAHAHKYGYIYDTKH